MMNKYDEGLHSVVVSHSCRVVSDMGNNNSRRRDDSIAGFNGYLLFIYTFQTS